MPAPKKIDADRENLEKLLSSYVQPYNISNLDVSVGNNRLVAQMNINNKHLKFIMDYNQYNQQYIHIGFYINNKYFNLSVIGAETYTLDDCASQLTDLIRKIHHNNNLQGMLSLETPTNGGIFYY